MRRFILLCGIVCLGCTGLLAAQDALKVDPKHYTLVSENDQVRILKIHYGAHEKSVMHSHPNSVAVFLSDATGRFTFADGKSMDFVTKSGDPQYTPATTHLPENTGDKPLDGILVELKGKGAAATKPAAAAKAAPKKM